MKDTEKDVARRSTLAEDITQIRRVLTGMLDRVKEPEADAVRKQVLRNIDELDLLEKDITTKAVGRRYPLLDPHKSASRSMRKEMSKFNEELAAKLRVIHDASKKITDSYIEGSLEEPRQELATLHTYILDARNYYGDRDLVLEGV